MAIDEFASLAQVLHTSGLEAMLTNLAERLAVQGRFHELFEVRKMQARRRFGLPLQYSDQVDHFDEESRNAFEQALLAACREVGLLLWGSGAVREGWMYLRPLGDRPAAAAALARIEATEENLDALLEVCLHEGVDVGRGFELMLAHYGTCNSITNYDATMPGRGRPEQRAAAAPLLRHVYRELNESLRSDIARQQGSPPAEPTIPELLANRPWALAGGTYHIDASHLASVVRIARVLDDAESHRLALELARYGERLDAVLQYSGHAPFVDTYPSHTLFYGALLGQRVAEAIAYFRLQAESPLPSDTGAAAETYVGLLSRLGQSGEALRESLRLMPADRLSLGSEAPSLLDLARASGEFEPLLSFFRSRGDLLGYGAALAESEAGAQNKIGPEV